MFNRRRARWALTAAVLFFGGATLAAEDPAAREKTAIDAMQSANAMSVRDGVYRQGRDALLAGSGSIKTKLEAWEDGTQQWLGGWMGGLLLGSTAMAAAGEVGKLKLDNQLAAIVGDVRQPLASLSVLAIRHGQPVYQQQFGDR